MKLKRRGVLARYGDLVAAVYEGAGIEVSAATGALSST
jgi:flagella basal body P-ring formation protein FlgA